MSGHMPGPWFVDEGPKGLRIGAPDGDDEPWWIADIVDCCGTPETAPANARLIAAAPETAAELERANAKIEELVGALEVAKRWFDDQYGMINHEPPDEAMDAVNAALANATPNAVEPAWSCKAQRSAGAGDPQDCDWPVCGCDPYADKVIAALEESMAFEKTAADMRERAAKLCDDKALCHQGTTSLFGDEAAQQLAKAIRSLPLDPDSATGDER